MKILLQIGVFFGICLAGQLIAGFLPFPVPSSIIGMILMFLLLCVKGIKPDHIQEKSDFLLENMAFFFIPAGVGIMESFGVFQRILFPFIVICVVTTLLTFAAVSFTVRGVIHLQSKRRDGRYE